MTTDDDVSLVDWTGRQIRKTKRGAIPAELAPILKRLNLDAEQWVQTVGRYGSLFGRMVGRAESMWDAAVNTGRRWLQGTRACETAFAPAET